MKKMAFVAGLTMLSGMAWAETMTTPLYLPPLSSSEIKQKEEPKSKYAIDVFAGIGVTPILSTNVEFFKDKKSMDSQTRGNFQVGAFVSERESEDLYMFRLAYSKIDFVQHVAYVYSYYDVSTYISGNIFYADFAFGEKVDTETKTYYGFGIGYGNRNNKRKEHVFYPYEENYFYTERYSFYTGRIFAGIDYMVTKGLHLFAEPMVYSINKSFKSPSIAVNVGGRIVF